jgi:hypothetical protein
MKYIYYLLIYLFVLSFGIQTYAQPWFLLDRQQKDSVIFNHTNKGNKYIGIGFNFGIGGGAWDVFQLKVEPSFGYFIFNNSLLAPGIIYEYYKIQVGTEYRNSTQISVGGFYRYYLPERNVLSPFFFQAGIYGGKMWGWQNIDSIYSETNFYVLNVIAGFGIALPINKFTIELGMNYEYQLFNRDLYRKYWGGKLFGILGFSYIL